MSMVNENKVVAEDVDVNRHPEYIAWRAPVDVEEKEALVDTSDPTKTFKDMRKETDGRHMHIYYFNKTSRDLMTNHVVLHFIGSDSLYEGLRYEDIHFHVTHQVANCMGVVHEGLKDDDDAIPLFDLLEENEGYTLEDLHRAIWYIVHHFPAPTTYYNIFKEELVSIPKTASDDEDGGDCRRMGSRVSHARV
jgi:hypothetical protein